MRPGPGRPGRARREAQVVMQCGMREAGGGAVWGGGEGPVAARGGVQGPADDRRELLLQVGLRLTNTVNK